MNSENIARVTAIHKPATGKPPLLRAEMREGVKWLILNRLSAANAINAPVQRALSDALNKAVADDNVVAVVLASASERIFSAGADLKEYADLATETARHRRRELLGETMLRIASFPKPVVACVTGKAIGAGCMLAFLCDEIIAGKEAIFSLPEVRLGMASPIAAAIARHRGGRETFQTMVLRGDILDGASAKAKGVVDVLSGTDPLADAQARAHALGAQNASAYGHTKIWAYAEIRAHLRSALAASEGLDDPAPQEIGA